MTKDEFLSQLRTGLAGLPEEDIAKSAEFYSEIIDDKIDEGMSAEEAVAAIGSPEAITAAILADASLASLIRKNIKSRPAPKPWVYVLLGLCFPLLLCAALFAIQLYLFIWEIVAAVYAASIAGGLAFLYAITAPLWHFSHIYPNQEIFVVGAGIVCGGLSILLFILALRLTGFAIELTKRLVLLIKGYLIRKENAQ